MNSLCRLIKMEISPMSGKCHPFLVYRCVKLEQFTFTRRTLAFLRRPVMTCKAVREGAAQIGSRGKVPLYPRTSVT